MYGEGRPLLQQPRNTRKEEFACHSKCLCLPSKAAILIILWTAVIGTVYTIFVCTFVVGISGVMHSKTSFVVYDSIPYSILAVVMTFYPVSGFIADVCCGRFKVIIASLICITLSLILLCLTTLIGYLKQYGTGSLLIKQEGTLIVLVLVLFTTGLIGYQSNFIQLGLDQLLEAQSHYLALFTHYAVWALSFTSAIITTTATMISCISLRKAVAVFYGLTIPGLTTTLIILLVISCWKHHWFSIQPGHNNPYRTVMRVLNFARKHKYPLQRSAFTYSDDYIPTRIDFAKQRYGGPFSTEQVENVKTFFRIISVLLTLGPIYVLQIPASSYVFPLFGLHTSNVTVEESPCSVNALLTLLVKVGCLKAAIPTISFPIYIWFIFSVLNRKLPKIFTRLLLGIILNLLGVISMLVIDVVGHSSNNVEATNITEPRCMFQVTRHNYRLEYQPINMHWSVLIPPSVFLGIGPLIITTTTLEFISAQSPHSMKGLLVGVSFAIEGFFQLLGYSITLPLSLSRPWTRIGEAIHSTLSCGSVYFLFTCMVGLIGLVLFLVASKRYKYRERDDENFSQRDVEEVYNRYLSQRSSSSSDSYED